MLTRSILAWHIVGEATALAYINLVVAVPMLLASLLGGAITDRIERRQIVIIGQAMLFIAELVEQKWRMNRFLFKWLGYCLHQGHYFQPMQHLKVNNS